MDVDLRLAKRISLLGVEEKEKLLGELEERVKFSGVLSIYPDVVIDSHKGFPDARYGYFSWDPLRDEYFLSRLDNKVKNLVPDDLETQFDLDIDKLSQKLTTRAQREGNGVTRKIDLCRYLGEGQIYVRYGERVPPSGIDVKVEYPDYQGLQEILDLSLRKIATLPDIGEIPNDSAHFAMCGNYVAFRNIKGHMTVFKRNKHSFGGASNGETAKVKESLTFIKAQTFIRGLKCSQKCWTDENGKCRNKCLREMLVYVGGYDSNRITINCLQGGFYVIVGPSTEAKGLHFIGGHTFALVRQRESLGPNETLVFQFRPGNPEENEHGGYNDTVILLQRLNCTFERRLGEGVFMDTSGNVYRISTNEKVEKFEKVSVLGQGTAYLRYPSRSRLKEVARMFERESGTNLEVLTIIMGFCCERIGT